MKDQVLSIEQMQHLKELGVDTSKAWLAYVSHEGKYWDIIVLDDSRMQDNFEFTIPCFDVSYMFHKIPNRVMVNNIDYYFKSGKRSVSYTSDAGEDICIFKDKLIRDCYYKAYCWLAENKLLGKEENELL